MRKAIAGLCVVMLVTVGCVSVKTGASVRMRRPAQRHPVRPSHLCRMRRLPAPRGAVQVERHAAGAVEIEQAFWRCRPDSPERIASWCRSRAGMTAPYTCRTRAQGVRRLIGTHLDKVLVFDFWAQR